MRAIRAKVLNGAGNMAWLQGDYAAARTLHEESLAIRRELRETWAIAGVLGNLGREAHRQGDVGRARQMYAESLSISRAVGARQEMVIALAGLGAVAGTTRQSVKGARLLGAVKTLLEVVGYALTPEDRAEYEQGVAAARAYLDEEAFATLWAEGRAMSMDQAIEYALQEIGDA